jgi:hypothetical protein
MNAPIGPYMNEDGTWWVPVEAASFKEARAEIIGCIQYEIPEDGTLVYKGKSMAWLDSEHEGYCGSECPTNRHVLAWRFEENPR